MLSGKLPVSVLLNWELRYQGVLYVSNVELSVYQYPKANKYTHPYQHTHTHSHTLTLQVKRIV